MYGTQCNDIISNIVFIWMFFTLFSNKNNYNKIRFFFQIMILEHLHFCLTNRASLSHLLCGQLGLLECCYRNCLIGTHMCVHPVSKWSVFLSFSMNCSQVVMFQIMPALCTHGQGEGGRGWLTKCGQAWTGAGGPKNSQICVDILYGWPFYDSMKVRILFY